MNHISRHFKKVKDYFDKHLWDENRVRRAVGRWITEEEFEKITGHTYAADKD